MPFEFATYAQAVSSVKCHFGREITNILIPTEILCFQPHQLHQLSKFEVIKGLENIL